MCAKYETPETREIERFFEIKRSNGMERWLKERIAFPGSLGPYVRLDEDQKVCADVGQFGLLPHWCKPENAKRLTRSTYNARTETVFEKPSYKTAWKHRNFCVIPAAAIYEPNYESGKPISWRISRADGKPIFIAGIHWTWKNTDTSEYLNTFTMLTINADDHPFMRRFHAPEDEKRSVVMLQHHELESWLRAANHDEARALLKAYSSEELVGEPSQ
jgi:putative SOS response-associated peptidase YedK